MPVPPSFKTDESFLQKIAMGAIGTKRTFQNLEAQGHRPIELERGSMSYKIWKNIKIKRVRVPDILCLRCGHRVESRAKTRMEIAMSHSRSRALMRLNLLSVLRPHVHWRDWPEPTCRWS